MPAPCGVSTGLRMAPYVIALLWPHVTMRLCACVISMSCGGHHMLVVVVVKVIGVVARGEIQIVFWMLWCRV